MQPRIRSRVAFVVIMRDAKDLAHSIAAFFSLIIRHICCCCTCSLPEAVRYEANSSVNSIQLDKWWFIYDFCAMNGIRINSSSLSLSLSRHFFPHSNFYVLSLEKILTRIIYDYDYSYAFLFINMLISVAIAFIHISRILKRIRQKVHLQNAMNFSKRNHDQLPNITALAHNNGM